MMDVVVGSMIGLSLLTIFIFGIWYWSYRRQLWFVSIESSITNNFEYIITMSNSRGKRFRFRGSDDFWFEERTRELVRNSRKKELRQIYMQYNWDQTNHQTKGK